MNSGRRVEIVIFVVALAARVGFLLCYRGGAMMEDTLLTADGHSYHGIAMSVLSGQGFQYEGFYARRAPVYPCFLAINQVMFGNSLAAVRMVHALLGAVTCLLIYRLGITVFNRAVGTVAGAISALYYPLILQTGYLIPEVLFTFLLTASFLFLARFQNTGEYLILFIGALVLAISALCKSVILPFVVILLAWIPFVSGKAPLKWIKSWVCVLLAMMIVVLPWTARNFRIYKTFIPVTVDAGRTLYYGNNPRATGGTGGWSKLGLDQFAPDGIGDVRTVESDRRMGRLACRYMVMHPGRTSVLAFRKLINMWRPYFADARMINKITMCLTYIPVMIMAFVGLLAFERRDWARYSLVLLLLVYYVGIHMVTLSVIRYRYPVMGFIIVLSASGLSKCVRRIRHRPVDALD